MNEVKLGEIFTIERDSNSGVPYSYCLTKLDQGLALVDYGVRPVGPVHPGSPTKVYFVFQALEEGETSYQLARYRIFDTSDIVYEQVMPVNVVKENPNKQMEYSEEQQNIVGGWSRFMDLTDEDQQIFDEAMENAGIIGVTYEPLKVSKQVVSGMNYRFICKTKLIYKEQQEGRAIVSISKYLRSQAVITGIQKI